MKLSQVHRGAVPNIHTVCLMLYAPAVELRRNFSVTSSYTVMRAAQIEKDYARQRYRQRIVQLVVEENLQGAAAVWAEANHRFPEDHGALAGLVDFARFMGAQGDCGYAIYLMDNALQMEPENPSLHNNLAMYLLAAGGLENALKCSHRAVELDPEDPEIRKNLGILYMEAGEAAQAKAEFQRALATQGIDQKLATEITEYLLRLPGTGAALIPGGDGR
jgi:Flp pilus assembly protein TadD